MTNNKKWYIGDVSLLAEVGRLRMSSVQIVDCEDELICNIRTYSQPIARKIVDCVNGYDEFKLEIERLKSKLKQCEITVNNVLGCYDHNYTIDYLAQSILNTIVEEE